MAARQLAQIYELTYHLPIMEHLMLAHFIKH
ncbi:hypothetical protein QOZ95_004766 [Paenibacillus brasilensis]|uniref:Uncharacterized protein n=1 Tax=Paenibacillus brasilensis TaxID=128574 RepID=A0ABU0L5N7_9BACL|nr:hypothetical protein [Paenibacillus brasilensis]